LIRYLALPEILALHRQIMESSGGAIGILSLEGLESSVAQPRMTFGEQELYPSLAAKASALGFSLVKSHPFIDGNKRTGHAAVEVFLFLNGYEFQASVDEQERVMLQLASGEMDRDAFTDWISSHIVSKR
jgi:death-on-curing protein